MITIYVMLCFDWLQWLETYLFKSKKDRYLFIEQDNYQSYRLCEYEVEEIYDDIDYWFCEEIIEETIWKMLD
jgi:hypothetical protein